MRAFLFAALPLTALLLPDHGFAGETAPCDKCKPAEATWDWKANGYALALDGDGAREAAKQNALDNGCAASRTYLSKTKLKCKGGCNTGDESERCEPSQEPKCTHGSHDTDKGMWTFVCRKTYAHVPGAPACDEEEAKRNPGFGMCDVNLRMTKSLACAAPDCPAAP